MRHRIAFISEHASPLATLGGMDSGGQNVYVAELVRVLASDSFAIDVYTRREDYTTEEIVNWLPHVRVIHISAGPPAPVPKEDLLPYMSGFTSEMIAFMLREQVMYSLVHANFFMSARVASEIKRIFGVPYVVTFHALGLVRLQHQKEADRFPPSRIDIERNIVADADMLIAECPQDERDLIDLYSADPAKIKVIQCGYNPCEFYPVSQAESRRRLGLPATGFIALQLGRMVPRKGVDNVIKSLACLREQIKDVLLLVVGGEYEGERVLETNEVRRLQQIAQQQQVEDHILFVGRKERNELKYYYAASDVFVTTPWYEPFGITPLEAMACGVPVIGSKVGGIKYSVVDGKTGFLVPPNEPEVLAEKITRFMSNAELRNTMGVNARKWVSDWFTWSYVGRSMKRAYDTLIESGRSYQNFAINQRARVHT
jgi:D-inositol-3-phosphate glycosyltransferase